jgi:hypothetical protein
MKFHNGSKFSQREWNGFRVSIAKWDGFPPHSLSSKVLLPPQKRKQPWHLFLYKMILKFHIYTFVFVFTFLSSPEPHNAYPKFRKVKVKP